MIRLIQKDKTTLIWQNTPEEGIAEPAILVTKYNDCIEIGQEGRTILVSLNSINELIKVLHSFKS